MADVLFLTGTSAEYTALETKVDNTFYFTTDTKELYVGAKKITNKADLDAAIAKYDGTEETLGSIRNIVAGYINALDTVSDVTIASKSGKAVSIAAGVSETDGVIGAGSGTAITLADVASTGNAEDVGIADTAGNFTATDVEGALAELATASSGGVASKTVYMVASGSTSDYAQVYDVYQGSTGSAASPVAAEKIGSINIPKDKVVESGSVKTVTTADVPYEGANVGDKYIELVLQNVTNPLYIPANSLVDIYTAEQSATQVQLVIDENNEISATIVSGSIGTTELAASAVTTAKIADANVTTAKIADDAVTADKVAISAHTESQTAGADGVAISVTTTDGQVSGVSASIAANTYDAYGDAAAAQAAVTGESTDDSDALTLYGLKARIDAETTRAGDAENALDARVDDLEDAIGAGGSVSEQITAAIEALDGSATIASKNGNVVTIKAGITEADGIVDNNSGTDIVLEEVASTGAAADVSIADAGSYTSETTVEGAIQEIYQKLTWQPIASA